MGWFELIVGAIKEFFGSFKFLDKWFTKSPTEKVEDRVEEIDELEEEFRKNGGRHGKK
jgi:hypothetical protein